MIHEFAVDPDALAGWHNFRYLVEHFGVENGRLISRFPKNWKRMVYEACNSCLPVEKKRIEEGLRGIEAKLLASGRSYDQSSPWPPNAIRSHAERPFRAIITTPERAGSNPLLDVSVLCESTEAWAVPRGVAINRNAKDLGRAAQALLNCSREIRLVDPHFSDAARFGRPLTEFIRHACAGRPLRLLEYHLKEDGCTAEAFKSQLLRQQPYMNLSNEVEIHFIRWNQLDDGDALHPRYILTDLGGLRFEHGLDEGDEGETTDVECLATAIYRERWQQYHPDSGCFDLVDAWVVTRTQVVEVEWRNGKFNKRLHANG